MNQLKRFYWIALSLILVVLDQLTKYIVVQKIPINDSIVVIPGFFSLSHVRNTGAAFGLFADHRWVFMVFTTIVLIVTGWLLISGIVKNHLGIVSLSMIISGGLGNMIDRVCLGEVVDFFAFKFWSYQFAVFNVADIFVCCGTFLLAFYIFFTHDFDGEKKVEESEDGSD